MLSIDFFGFVVMAVDCVVPAVNVICHEVPQCS